MKKKSILILSVGFIPEKTREKTMSVVEKNFLKIRQQVVPKNYDISIYYADDGSYNFANFAHDKEFCIYDSKTNELPINYDCDKYVITPKIFQGKYSKGEIINFVIREILPAYTHLILLDDDQELLFDNSIVKFSEYFDKGYDFVIGRLIDPTGVARHFLDNTVQGTTLGFSKNLLNQITPITPEIINWGAGEDTVIFHSVWLNKGKSCCVGSIISIDMLSKRWAPAESILKTIIQQFHIGFERLYQLHPLKIPARNKKVWTDIEVEGPINEKYLSVSNATDLTKLYKGNFFDLHATILKLKLIFWAKKLYSG